MTDPNISIRRWIKWLPGEPQEPTTTIVLTSGARRYVDVRILKFGTDQTCGPETYVDAELPLSRLEWAFAGMSEREPSHKKDGKTIPAHSKWHHWVDSKAPAGVEAPTDEGDMFPQEDGQELEKGSMVNPETGKLTDYEEMWVDVEVERVVSVTSRVCVALVAQEDERLTRGMIVRVGQYCQGIVQDGVSLSVERWTAGNGTWQMKTRIGKMPMPCIATFSAESLKLGDAFETGNEEKLRWTVVELVLW